MTSFQVQPCLIQMSATITQLLSQLNRKYSPQALQITSPCGPLLHNGVDVVPQFAHLLTVFTPSPALSTSFCFCRSSWTGAGGGGSRYGAYRAPAPPYFRSYIDGRTTNGRVGGGLIWVGGSEVVGGRRSVTPEFAIGSWCFQNLDRE